MHKYKLFLILSGFLMSFSAIQVQANGFSLEEIKEQILGAKTHSDACVVSCRDYYNKNNNLQGFSYSNNFKNHVAEFILEKGLNWLTGQKTNFKKTYCEKSRESLMECYKQDSWAYSVCKLGAQNIAGWVTKDPNWKDYFASCKATCLKDLNAFCGEN